MESTKDTKVHSGHRARMRQRVRNEGFESLEPHEVIEFLLFYAIPRQDVNALAHRLVETFGSVQAVLAAAPDELRRVPGIGPRAAKWLSLTGEAVASCAHLSPADRPRMRSCMDVFRYAARAERELDAPCCVQLCLDVAGRLIFQRSICASLSWGEPETLRDALRDMLICRAHDSILLLLTGSRAPEPSEYDVAHAAAYSGTLRAADCMLLDIVLVGGGALNSMQRLKQIPPEAVPSAAALALREDYLLHMPEGAVCISDFREVE